MPRNRTSAPLIIFISAVIGAIVGAVLAYGVLGNAMSSQMETRFASFTSAPSDFSQMVVPDGGSKNPSSGAVENVGGLDAEEQIVTEVYSRLSPSVVHVSTVMYYRSFFQIVPQEGTGSGFIISEDGYILTNNHVISGAQEITVRMHDGGEYKAKLVGTDPFTDLAVLQVQDVDIPPEWVAPLGDSDHLRVGQRAIAIGNPFGLDSTVTVGVISALDRPLTIDDTTFDSMIQTDASINPGNSGGPLIDSSGKVIGINTVILSQSGGSHGVGFAIPVNQAKTIYNDLIQYGHVIRPTMGFRVIPLFPNLAQALELDINFGLLVQAVDPDSSAWGAGLRAGRQQVILRDRFRQYSIYVDGDIIVALNGEPIRNLSDLADRIRRMEIGTEVVLTVYRDGEQVDLNWVLSEQLGP